MKKISMTAVLIAAIAFSASAQKLDASKVPAKVKASMTRQFPGVTAKWEMEDGKYEANFKQGDKVMSAMFEVGGTFTESEMDIKITDLPANVVTYVNEHYKGKSIKEAAKITKANGTVNYEAEVEGKDVIFDANGKFLKEAKA